MAEINVNVGVVVPETPKTVPNEQLSVYVPYASIHGPGIVPYASEGVVGAALFYHLDFEFDAENPGQVRIKQLIRNYIDYAVNTIGGSVNDLIYDSDTKSYTHLELKTNAKQLIPAINENKDAIDALSDDVEDNKEAIAALEDRIGVGTIINPDNGALNETNLVRLANANRRKLNEVAGILNNHTISIDVLENDSKEIKNVIGQETLDTNSKTIKGAINESFSVANNAIDNANRNRTSIVNLNAQMQGIGRSYVVADFPAFINFLKGRTSITLKEDRDCDGAEETYTISISDLKTGDNIVITEKNVPDFWFDKNSALTSFETYTYNGEEYTLSATKQVPLSEIVIGGAHALEADYTVIGGYATSASVSAAEAKVSETNAKEAETRIAQIVEEYIGDIDEIIGGGAGGDS